MRAAPRCGAALDVLLASPVRVTTCRAPLEDFLVGASADQATRIREALARSH